LFWGNRLGNGLLRLFYQCFRKRFTCPAFHVWFPSGIDFFWSKDPGFGILIGFGGRCSHRTLAAHRHDPRRPRSSILGGDEAIRRLRDRSDGTDPSRLDSRCDELLLHGYRRIDRDKRADDGSTGSCGFEEIPKESQDCEVLLLNVLILGATGRVGSRVALALGAGHFVTALARSREKLAEGSERLTVIQGRNPSESLTITLE